MPGCRDIVRNGVNGILVPPRQPFAVAAAIERLLIDADLRREMGEAGRSLAAKEFGLEIVVGATLEIYSRMVSIGASERATAVTG
jgi:glycosyltransferase involved in cell wall biosynthesis